MAFSIIAGAGVAVRPLFNDLSKDTKKEFGRVFGKEGAKAGLTAGKAIGEGTAKGIRTSEPVIRKRMTAMATSLGSSLGSAGTAAGRAFTTRTATGIASGAGRVQNAATRIATTASNLFRLQGITGGNAFSKAVSSGIATGATAVSRAAGTVGAAASRVISGEGLFAGSGFLAGVRSAIAAGAGAVSTAASAVGSAASRALSALGVTGGGGFIGGVRSAITAAAGSLRATAAGIGSSMAATFKGAGTAAGAGFASSFMASLGPLAGMLALFAPVAVIASGANRSLNIEDAEAKLGALKYEAEEIASIRDSALTSVKGTPFALDQAFASSTGLLAAGVEQGDELTQTLKNVGDTAALAGTDFATMGAIWNKAAASNKVQGDILAQLGDKGVPIVKYLAEELGTTGQEVYRLAEEGKIDFKTFNKAMQDNVGGMAKTLGDTTRGAFANFRAALTRLGESIWDAFDKNGVVKDALKDLTEKIDIATARVGDFLGRITGWVEKNPWVVTVFQSIGVGLGAIAAAAGAVAVVRGVVGAIMLLAAHPVILAIGLIAAGIFYLYQTNEDFREKFLDVWDKVKTFVVDAWNNDIKPALQRFADWFTTVLVPAVTDFWNNTLYPIFTKVGDFISTTWTNTIQPALSQFWDWIVNVLAPALQDFWYNVALPVFSTIGTVIQTVWNDLIYPALSALWEWVQVKLIPIIQDFWLVAQPIFENVAGIIQTAWVEKIQPALSQFWDFIQVTLIPALLNFWEGVVLPIFTLIASIISFVFGTIILPLWQRAVDFLFNILFPALGWLLNNVVGPVFAGVLTVVTDVVGGVIGFFQTLVDWLIDDLPTAWQDGVNAISNIWDTLKEKAKTPIRWIIETVVNKGLIPAFNTVRGWFGMDAVEEMPIPYGLRAAGKPVTERPVNRGQYARGGILPGQSRYTDGDDQLVAMRRGEGVYVSEAMRDPYERERLFAINRAAMRGERLDKFREYEGFAKGGLVRPFAGQYPQTSGYRSAARPTHNGVDFAMPVGTPLYAMSDGVVSGAGRNLPGGTGLMVRLTTAMTGIMSRYHHMSKILVAQGQAVKQGQLVGLSGNTGNSTGPHLHVSILRDGKDVDPMSYLSGGGAEGGGFFSNPFEFLWNKIKDTIPVSGEFAETILGGAKNLIGSGVQWAKDKIASIFDFGGASGSAGGAEKWRSLAATALKRTGQYSPENLESMLRRINQESGGDPNAVNNWDSNARRGTPSKGLLQTIPSTFAAYRDKSLPNNIYDPFANMVASINYAVSRYGSVGSAYNRKGGYAEGGIVEHDLYDTGGWLNPGFTAALNKTGKPEAILTNEQWKDISSIAGVNGNVANGNVNFNGPIYTHDPKAVANAVVRKQQDAMHAYGINTIGVGL
jgi:tape measure domain-containing protein